jgi:AraC-like DNA-binding protein
LQRSIKKQLAHYQFLQRENYIIHRRYEDELERLTPVRIGDIKTMQEQLSQPWPSSASGKLSDDPVRNAQYLFTCYATVLARIAVESGVELEAAYGISDLYIQAMDKCVSIDEIAAIRREMAMHYTKLVADLKRQNIFSKPIVQCLDYIYDNLHQSIKVDELAAAIGLSSSYFSTLFKKEVGISASEYIRRKRVETAENMIRHSGFTLTEISQYLSFSSYSHFADIFRNYTGCTPKEYQNKYFRTSSVRSMNG